jgi:hypothetical protein
MPDGKNAVLTWRVGRQWLHADGVEVASNGHHPAANQAEMLRRIPGKDGILAVPYVSS